MTERGLVAGGLLVAVAAGIAGGAFESVAVSTWLYALSSLGWVVATALLAFRHADRGDRLVAAGFLVLTVAESLLWVSGRVDSQDYEAGFAGGVMFYVPGLLLIAVPGVYHWSVRTLAAVAAAVWAAAAAGFLSGSGLAEDDPIALVGYTVLSAAFIGIAIVTMRSREADWA